MRKWVRSVIALIAIVGIGVVAYVLLQPKLGTVEWHKRRCMRLYSEGHGGTLRWKIHGWWFKLTGKELVKVTDEHLDKLEKELKESLEKLQELGFFVRREYSFTNVLDHEAIQEILRPEIVQWFKSAPFDRQVFRWTESGASAHGTGYLATVWIIAPREEMAEWDGIVAKTNLPAIAREVSVREYRERWNQR